MTKFQATIKEFGEAIDGLDAVLKKPKDEFIRDSAIKRFELTFDLSWKSVKAFLEEKGVMCASPVGCFREAYRQGLIDYDEQWVDLVEIRNKTVHTYNEPLAEEVYSGLPAALELFRKLHAALAK